MATPPCHLSVRTGVEWPCPAEYLKNAAVPVELVCLQGQNTMDPFMDIFYYKCIDISAAYKKY